MALGRGRYDEATEANFDMVGGAVLYTSQNHSKPLFLFVRGCTTEITMANLTQFYFRRVFLVQEVPQGHAFAGS